MGTNGAGARYPTPRLRPGGGRPGLGIEPAPEDVLSKPAADAETKGPLAKAFTFTRWG